MLLKNPHVGAPFGSSGRGWFEVGLAWFVVGFAWVSEQKHVFEESADISFLLQVRQIKKQGETFPSLIRLGKVVSLLFV